MPGQSSLLQGALDAHESDGGRRQARRMRTLPPQVRKVERACMGESEQKYIARICKRGNMVCWWKGFMEN